MMTKDLDMSKFRTPDYEIPSFFTERWSPRAMSGEEVTREELMRLFEAARWAPSSFNNQPWRFLYSLRNSEHWKTFLSLLVPLNKVWSQNSGVLIVVLSKRTFDYNNRPSPTHSFDAGAAWQNLALMGSVLGLAVHAMQGFEYEKTRIELNIPEEYEVEAMVAVGRPGPLEVLPEKLRDREVPSGRKKVSELVTEGGL